MKKDKERTAKGNKFAKSLVAGAVGVTSLIAMVSFTGCGEDKNKEPSAFTVSISSELEGFEGRDITVNRGTKIKDLKSMFVSPVKGYKVAGFYSDFLCTKEYDDEELVDENTKIFIKFVVETFTVRVYGERKNANPELLCDPITVEYNNLAEVETPTKDPDERGTYKFAGWEDINGNPVDLKNLKITEDIDVYATFVLDQQAQYSIGVIPKGVTVTRGGEHSTIVESNTKLAYGERIKITYQLSEGHRFIDFSVTGADEVAGANDWYEVHDDVKIVFEQEAIKYVVGNIPEQVKIFRITKTEEGEQREAIASGSEVTHGDILDITHVPTVGKHKTKLDVSGIFPLGGEQFGVSVTGNITVDYEEDWNTAVVKLFNDDKKELLLGKTVKHGEGIEAETPTKPSNPLDYTNVFVGWVDEDGKPFDISRIELPTYDEKNPEPVINVYASYRKEYVYYDVTIPANVIVTNDGVKLGAGDKVNYGDELIITFKEDTGKHKDVFTVNGEAKENSDIFVVTGNVNIVYEQKLNTATYKFSTGSEIVEVEVEHGKNVAVPADPTKAPDNTFTYAFAGWVDGAGKTVNFENVSVLSNESVVEIFAKFDATHIEYTIAEIPANVTITKGGVELSSSDTLHFDDEIIITYEETTGFDVSNFAVDGATRQGETNVYKVTGNLKVVYSEVYETYSVLNVPTGVTVIRESDSKSLKTGDEITFNDKLTISYSLTEGYHLKTFTVNGTAYETNDVKLTVTCALNVQFAEEINKYTVVFKNYDGTKLDEVVVDYNGTATTTVVGAKDSTAKYTYTFAGWVDSEGNAASLENVKANTEVFASFDATLNDYKLTLTGNVSVVRDGKTLTAADSVHIDDVLTITYTEQTGYHKTSFTVNGTECVNGISYTVAGETTVVYAEEKNEATYIFYVEGAVVKTTSAKHGENVELPTTPTKEADTKYTYAFDNWCDATLSSVVKLSDISVLENGSTVKVYARFTENYIDYAVSVSDENRITVTDSKGNVLSADSKVHVDDVLTITYSPSEGHHKTNFTVSGATRQGETDTYVVTGTVSVVYSEDIDTFKVVFMDYDKTTKLDEITVDWGTAASIAAPTRVQDERFTYEFRAWTDADGKDVDLSSVKKAVTVYAAYTSTHREYTIAAIPENVTITKDGVELSSSDTLHFDDEIIITYKETAGFDVSNFAVNGATRQGETNVYKVTGNLKVVYSEVYETYSVLNVPTGVTVIRESDGKSLKTGDAITFNDKLTISYSLTEGHHLKTFTVNGTAYETSGVKLTVTGDLTVTFEEEINKYTVVFKNYDGTKLDEVVVDYNGTATTTVVGVKDSTAKYTYTFAGWVDSEGNAASLENVKANTEVFASFDETLNDYTLSLTGNVSVVRDGKTLTAADSVHIDDVLTITYTEQTGYHKTSFTVNGTECVNGINYTVVGETAVVYAEEKNEATYKFFNGETLFKTVTVKHGESIELSETPTKAADNTFTYGFSRWLAANKQDAAVLTNIQVLANGSEVSVYAEYSKTYIEYTIAIPEYVTVERDGKVLSSADTLHFGQEIVISYSLREGYHVKKFTLNGSNVETNNFAAQVSGNMTIEFEDEINTYTVVFMDADKTTKLGEKTVNYNTAAALGTTPTKDSDNTYDYTFAGWVDAEGNAVSLENVKANTTVYASYSSTYIEYTIAIPANVTVTKGGVEIESTSTLHFGEKIVVTYSESTGFHKTLFKINGAEQTANSVEFSVVGNTTISYEEAQNTATVVFVSEGTEHARVSVKHGEDTVLPANPTKAADSTYTYEFAGWLASNGSQAVLDNMQVLENGSIVTVTAKFNPVYIEYSLTIPDGVTVKDSDGNTLSADSKVHFGDKVKIVYAERTGYHKTSFKVDGTEISVAAGEAYQHTVAGNLVIEYADAINTYLITIPRGVSVTRDGEPLADGDVVSHFDSLVVSYVLDEGFHLDTFAVNGTVIENGGTVVVSGNVEVSFLQEENTATYKFFNENTLFAEVGAKHGENVALPANPTKNADSTFTYSFAKWVDKNGKDISFENIAVASNGLIVEVYASYTSTYIEYTIAEIPANVTITKGGVELSSSDTLHYDDEITITYEETTGYDVSNFAVDGAIRQGETNVYKVTGNLKVVYSEVYETYSVLNVPIGVTVIRESDGKSLKTGDEITFNDKLTISYALTEGHHLKTFTVNGTAYETNDVKLTVTGALNVQFAEEIDTFTVVFMDADKTTKLGEKTVNYNTAAALDTTPTKDSDSTYDYTFAGWVDAEGSAVSLDHVKANTTVYASYSSSYIEYTIAIPANVTVTKGGVELSNTSTLHFGEKIVVTYSESAGFHKTLFKINGAEQTANSVEFSVVGNTTISYEEAQNTATVVFVSEGTEHARVSVKHGEDTVLPANPTKAADSTYTYEFAGWLASNGSQAVLDNMQVLENGSTVTVTAKFNPVYIDYTLVVPSGVSVTDEDGNTLENGSKLHYEDEIFVSYTESEGFHKTVFTVNGVAKNNGDKVVVDGATTIVFEQTENTATYNFISDGKVISSVTVKHGQNVAVPADPTKAADSTFTYSFSGWNYHEYYFEEGEAQRPPLLDEDFENVSVLSDQSVVNIYACYVRTYIEYSIRFTTGVKVFKGGKEISDTDTFHFGDKLTVSYTESTGFHKTVFTVNGTAINSGDEIVVSGNTTIVFNETENQATYKFFADGKLVQTSTVLHGGSVVAPTVQKTADSKFTYGNYGWSLTEQAELCTAEYAEQNPLPAVSFKNISVETDGSEVVYYMHFYTVFVEYSLSIVDEGPANVVVKKGDTVIDANTVLHYDDIITITCTPTEGHNTAKFVVDGATDLGDGTYKVTGNVSVEYEEAYKTFAIVVPENVTVLRDGQPVTSDSVIRFNDELVISYTPSEGHHMTTFTVNGETFANGGSLVVSGNITVVYAEAVNTYTVTFMNEDRTETLGTVTVDYNTAATFAAPEKPTNIPYSYTFTGWVDAEGNAVSLENIKADITVSPAYETVNMYPYLHFYLNGDTCSVSGDRLMGDSYTDYVIPATYLGNPVTEIADIAFDGFYNIKSVTIPASITKIGDDAFHGCSQIETVTFLGTIDDWAQIEFVGSSLSYAKLLIGGVEIKDVVLTSATKITMAFADRNITSIKIPSTVQTIHNRAFYGCTSLASVTVDSSSIYSKLAAGEGCGYLVNNATSLKILASIDDGSNNYVADNFIKVATTNGYNEYVSAEYLFVLEENATGYKITGVRDNTVAEIQIPNCLRGNPINEIGAFAFSACSKLAAVNLPENIKVIGEGAFEGCNRITGVNYLGTVSSWANISFASEMSNPIYYSQSLSINDVEVVGNVTISGVDSISNYAFYNCKNIKGLTISGTANQTTIGESAFIYCTGLEYVDMSRVSTIGANAFAGCTKLVEVVVAAETLSIGNNAFGSCSALATVTVESATIYGALTSADACGGLIKNATNIKVAKTADDGTNSYLSANFIRTDDGDYISYVVADEVLVFTAVEGGGYTVSGLKEGVTVQNLTIPATYNNQNVTSIAANAFDGNTSLKNVVLSEGITSVSELAFNGNTNLESVTFPSTLATFGDGAFMGCSSLKAATIPESVTDIGNMVFDGCTSLETINYNAGITTDFVDNAGDVVYKNIFANAGKNAGGITLNIGENVTLIPSGMFVGVNPEATSDADRFISPKITTLNFVGNKVTEIGTGAFGGCKDLTSITIPESVTSIGGMAFAYCTGVETLNYNTNNIADLINESGESSENRDIFLNLGTASSGVTLNIAENVTRIPAGLFAGTLGEDIISGPKFAVINFGANVTEIGEAAFAMCQFVNPLVLPISVTTIGVQAFVMADVESVEILGNVTRIENGTFMQCTNLKSIILPSTLKVIDAYAFVMCGLESLTIPGSVEEINCAFAMNANLTTLVVEEGCTAIGDQAFMQCSSLANVTLPSTLKTLDSRAFAECTALKSITIPGSVTTFVASFLDCTGLETVIIEDGVTEVGNGVFEGCSSLKNVVIPDSVTKIGYSAFAGCSGLTSIAIGAGVVDINISFEPFKDCTSLAEVAIRSSYVYKNASSKTALGGLLANATKIKVLATADDGSNTYLNSNFIKTTEGDYNVYVTADQVYNFTLLDGGTYQVDGLKDGVTLIELNIPATYNGKAVTSIANNAFASNTSLTSVTIPEGVTSIGNSAFNGCNNIANLVLPNSLVEINSWSFSGCRALTSITIPENVTTIGNNAFMSCFGLTEIKYNAISCTDVESNSQIFYSAGSNGDGINLVVGNNVQKIPNYLFCISGSSNAPKITSIEFGSGVTSIGQGSFGNCTYLTAVTIPSNITEIGTNAFEGCSNLTTITVESLNVYKATITEKLDYMDRPYLEDDFGNLYKYATTVRVRSTVDDGSNTYLNNNFIKTTEGDYNVYVSADQVYNFTLLGDGTYEVTGLKDGVTLTQLSIPATYQNKAVTSIGNSAFSRNTSLTSITIPDSVTSICIGAFNGCSSLVSINLSKGITTIEDGVFGNCSSLTNIVIPEGVTEIGENAFDSCTALESITLPSTLAQIVRGAFEDCSALSSITIPSSVTFIGSFAFNRCTSLTTVTVEGEYGYNVANAGFIEDGLAKYATTVRVRSTVDDGSNTYLNNNFIKTTEGDYNVYVSADQVYNFTLLGDGTYEVTGLKDGVTLTQLSIPATYNGKAVTSIGEDAFNANTNLNSVIIPNGITKIGLGAFDGCTNLNSVTIPNSVTVIEANAFFECTSLTSIIIPQSVTKIYDCAFGSCTNLTTVNLQNGIKELGDGAFGSCKNLTNITIPSSITNIGNNVFSDCTSLATVTIESANVYASATGTNFDNAGKLLEHATMVKVLASVDDGTNTYLNNNFVKTTEGDYNVYVTADQVLNLTLLEGDTYQVDGPKDGVTLTELNIPATYNGKDVTRIAKGAFASCGSLTSITIPGSVETVEDYAFKYCRGLTSVTIQNGVQQIKKGAFSGCIRLTSITIPNSVISISESTFEGCTGLTSITIPSSLTSIGNSAFNNCTGLATVIIENANVYAAATGVDSTNAGGLLANAKTIKVLATADDGTNTYLNNNFIKTTDGNYNVYTKSFTVTFMDDDKTTVLGTEKFATGSQVQTSLSPTKASTAQYNYTFAGWVNSSGNAVDLSTITSNTTVYAKYTSTVRNYAVTFYSHVTVKNGSTTISNGASVPYGTILTISCTPSTGYHLSAIFVNNKVFTNGGTHTVTGAVSVTYNEFINKATYNFYNGSTLISTTTVNHGGNVTVPNDPSKADDDNYTYTFDKWVTTNGGTTEANFTNVSVLTDGMVVNVYASYNAYELSSYTLNIVCASGVEVAPFVTSSTTGEQLVNGDKIIKGDTLTIGVIGFTERTAMKLENNNFYVLTDTYSTEMRINGGDAISGSTTITANSNINIVTRATLTSSEWKVQTKPTVLNTLQAYEDYTGTDSMVLVPKNIVESGTNKVLRSRKYYMVESKQNSNYYMFLEGDLAGLYMNMT